MEAGEANVAFRLGARPENPDYVVIPHHPVRLGLYSSEEYIAQWGMPQPATLAGRRFTTLRMKPSFNLPELWLRALVHDTKIFIDDEGGVVENVLTAGVGIGFSPVDNAAADLSWVSLVPRRADWEVPRWIVTHVDLHRSPAVRAFIAHCRSRA